MKGMTGGESLVRASRYTRWFHEGSCGEEAIERERVLHTTTHHSPQQPNTPPHPEGAEHPSTRPQQEALGAASPRTQMPLRGALWQAGGGLRPLLLPVCMHVASQAPTGPQGNFMAISHRALRVLGKLCLSGG